MSNGSFAVMGGSEQYDVRDKYHVFECDSPFGGGRMESACAAHPEAGELWDPAAHAWRRMPTRGAAGDGEWDKERCGTMVWCVRGGAAPVAGGLVLVASVKGQAALFDSSKGRWFKLPKQMMYSDGGAIHEYHSQHPVVTTMS